MPSIVDFLYKSNEIEERLLSLCWGMSGKGILTFGEENTEKHVESAKTVVLKTGNWTYSFSPFLKDIRVGGLTIGLPKEELNRGGGITIDTGSSYSLIPAAWFE